MDNASLKDGGISASKVGPGQLVKSINGLRDDVSLVAGSNVTITPNGSNLTISAAGAGTGSSTNQPNTLVLRDASGGFAAGALTVDALRSSNSLSVGSSGTAATGSGSIAVGSTAQASGPGSAAFGVNVTASGLGSIAAGELSRANGKDAAAFGQQNTASGDHTLTAGTFNFAGGPFSVVLGYKASTTSAAAGTFIFTDGSQTATALETGVPFQFIARAVNGVYFLGNSLVTPSGGFRAAPGSFVFADGASNSSQLVPSTPNQFLVRATGGVSFLTDVAGASGVTLAPGGGSWASVSDRNRKEHFRSVDADEILRKVAALPVTSWNYKGDRQARRYIGPMAQDFHSLFGLGSDTTIATLDMDGVTITAVKALERRTAELDRENGVLRAELTRMRHEHEDLLMRLQRLEQVHVARHELSRGASQR